MRKKPTRFEKISHWAKDHKLISIVLVIGFSIIFLGQCSTAFESIHDSYIKYLAPSEDEKLYKFATKINQDLSKFIGERKAKDPTNSLYLKPQEYLLSTSIDYSNETEQIYRSRFLSNIIFLKNEFAKRGIQNDNLNKYYKFPVNYFVYTDIAVAIVEMANELKATEKEG